jgi:hypothetical protein
MPQVWRAPEKLPSSGIACAVDMALVCARERGVLQFVLPGGKLTTVKVN